MQDVTGGWQVQV